VLVFVCFAGAIPSFSTLVSKQTHPVIAFMRSRRRCCCCRRC
jgi:hypothetical protein